MVRKAWKRRSIRKLDDLRDVSVGTGPCPGARAFFALFCAFSRQGIIASKRERPRFPFAVVPLFIILVT
jgi:hypothetical protein